MSVHTKEGVRFDVIAPAGFRILAAIDQIAQWANITVTITSGTDGVHPAGGAQDPHYRGEAYDIRTHDLPDAHDFLAKLQQTLGPLFFAFIEFEGTPNEHLHCQLRNGQTFI